ncbi:MAG: orotidine-5'-phosphate decarboxylase [Proteobacteria bacterium]|nr:orotidine-5'-phosphate decarboxylase [Pseudomonadota bacterium]
MSKQAPSVIFALDVPTATEALAWVDRLSPDIGWYKVGLELFVAEGPALVQELKSRGVRVFLDLKLLDIPATVKRTMDRIAALGVDLATVHVTGGPEMLAAAREGAGGQVKVVAVTLLTSMAAGPGEEAKTLVLSRARMANDAGLSGVVCSGLEVGAMKKAYPGLLAVCPGIRPAADRGRDDQKRVVTAGQAAAAGADFLVVGRPIRDAAEPLEIVGKMMEEIRRATG